MKCCITGFIFNADGWGAHLSTQNRTASFEHHYAHYTAVYDDCDQEDHHYTQLGKQIEKRRTFMMNYLISNGVINFFIHQTSSGSHHYNNDHRACQHAGNPGFFREVGLLHSCHWVLLHRRGHCSKLGTWRFLCIYERITIFTLKNFHPVFKNWLKQTFFLVKQNTKCVCIVNIYCI